MVYTSLTKFSIQDLVPGSTKTSGKKIDVDAILPYFIVPGLLLIATISRTVTITVMVVIAMGALYVQSRPRQKNRSSFFFSWTLSSAVCLFLIFENGILGFFEITMLENFIFLVLLACTLYFFYKMKIIAEYELTGTGTKGKEYSPVLTSDSHYCQICQIEVNERFFHSIWWDCCVLRPNYIHFLAGHIFAFATLLLGTNLGLTTVCQPFILYEPILMPLDCEDIYYDFNMSISFVACVYALGYALVIAVVLIRQLIVYLPKYSEPQWKKLVNVLNV
ncbi:unnamed protein product [Spodoptera littoralis]|uniref:Palmitoyltransferase n=1 Tax=Spodoptera littoralis TaxID=7109 RepID=A0A9P0IIU2_SPOLI|nr:unnamed protein product [Spodoptera littoralis]CAH1646607.1 unnamed protein product [Spodoptera littoralis]